MNLLEQSEAARERGEFDDLPGAGRHLVLDHVHFVAPELRTSYRELNWPEFNLVASSSIPKPWLSCRTCMGSPVSSLSMTSDRSHVAGRTSIAT